MSAPRSGRPRSAVAAAFRALSLLLACACALTGCGRGAEADDEPAFTVAAAASLTGVMDAALARYGTRGRARGVYASSSTLAHQIEQGAPFDLYVGASPEWMDYLAERGLVDAGSRRDVAANALVLVQPVGAAELAAELRRGVPLPRALAAGRWTTGDPEHVPLGRYARAGLVALGWWPELEGGLVAAADARAALRLVERGEIDWGVVYRTDALASQAVRLVALVPAELHDPIVYPAARTSAGRPSATAFLDWLGGTEGRALFAARGFLPASTEAPR